MKIDEILKKESVIANLVGKNKLEVIKEMTTQLLSFGLEISLSSWDLFM